MKKLTIKKKLIKIITLLLLFLSYPDTLLATNWHINTFSALNPTIKKSKSGDTIYLAAGIYSPPPFPKKTNKPSPYYAPKDIKINKSLHFIGEGGQAVFMAGDKKVPIVKGLFSISGDVDVSFKNIDFKNTNLNGPSGNTAGIRMLGGSLTVINCHFENNKNGILFTHGESVTIKHSKFINNGYLYGQTHGVYIEGNHILIEDSIFRNTRRGNHIKALGLKSTIIRNNIIDDGTGNPARAVDTTAGGDLLVEGNTITRNADAKTSPRIIYYSIARIDTGGGTGKVIIRNNTIYNYKKNGTILVLNHTDKPILVENNTIKNITGLMSLGTGLINSRNNKIDNVLQPNTNYKDNSILGTAFNDRLTYSSKAYDARQKYNLLAGNDRIEMRGQSIDTIFGGDGNDILLPGLGQDNVFGENGDDIIFDTGGYANPSILSGGAGNDIIVSSANNMGGPDFLIGGAGNDILYGVQSRNKLLGQAGDDILIGGKHGDFRITGGEGNDFLDGGMGNDNLYGGDGDDTIIPNADHDSTINGGKGIDVAVIAGNFSDYILSAGAKWHPQPSTKVKPKSLNYQEAVKEVGKYGEILNEIEFIQFDNGVYDVTTTTFVTGAQRVNLSIYKAIRVTPTSVSNIIKFNKPHF